MEGYTIPARKQEVLASRYQNLLPSSINYDNYAFAISIYQVFLGKESLKRQLCSRSHVNEAVTYKNAADHIRQMLGNGGMRSVEPRLMVNNIPP
jgi:hypothetical protein